jgi:hypothetical protein
MIETKLTELTEAIRQLTAALNHRNVAAPAPAPVVPAKVEAPAPVPKAKPAPAPEPAPSAEDAEDIEETPAVPPPGKVTQADLRDAASKLLEQKKLPEILRINREHGIRRITECPEEKYESVYAALTAALTNGS